MFVYCESSFWVYYLVLIMSIVIYGFVCDIRNDL